MTTHRLATLVVALFAFTLAACGGGEEVSPTATAAPRATSVPTVAPQPTATAAPRPTATPQPQPTATARPPAPATPTAAPSAAAGKLVVAVSSFYNDVIIPARGAGISSAQTQGAPMFDWLVWGDKSGGISPGVLVKWEMAPDAKSWTVTVREGMPFHNGDMVGAADVKFSLESVAAPQATSSGAGAFKANIASVDVVSPTVARVNLKNPWPLFPYDISLRAGAEGQVVPKAYTEKVGEQQFELKPVGTGPWKMARHDVGVRFSYEPSGVRHPFRELPKFKELELVNTPEESTRVAMLKTGAANIIELANFERGVDLSKSK